MRRPHVYERSAPRRRRDDGAAAGADPVGAARGVARAMPALIAAAEAAGLVELARLLDVAWAEAERAEGAAPPRPRRPRSLDQSAPIRIDP